MAVYPKSCTMKFATETKDAFREGSLSELYRVNSKSVENILKYKRISPRIAQRPCLTRDLFNQKDFICSSRFQEKLKARKSELQTLNSKSKTKRRPASVKKFPLPTMPTVFRLLDHYRMAIQNFRVKFRPKEFPYAHFCNFFLLLKSNCSTGFTRLCVRS